MRWHRFVAAGLALAAVAPASGLAAPLYSDATLAQYFRVDWSAKPGAVAGYVENLGNVPVEHVKLAVDRLDPTGAVVGTSMTRVFGIVPGNDRIWFSARVPAAAAYRVRVLSFDWVNCRE